MFIELVYNKQHLQGVNNAQEIIQNELQKRIRQIYPEAEVRVISSNADALRTDAGERDRNEIRSLVEAMIYDKNKWIAGIS